MDVTGDRSKVQCCKEQYCIGTWNLRSMNQGKLEVVKQEMARVNVDILGISELKWTGMGEFNSDDHYIYYCGQESLRRNGAAMIVNKRVRNAVLGCNLKNDRMISVHFQGKPFNSTVIAALEFNQKLNFITKGLSFKALASFKNWSSSNNMRSGHWNKFSLTGYEEDGNGGYNYMTSRIGDEYQTNLSASNSTSGNRRFYIEGMLNYSRTFDKHDVNAMIIYNQDELAFAGNGKIYSAKPAGDTLAVANRVMNTHREMLDALSAEEKHSSGSPWELQQGSPLQFDVTDQVTASGTYTATFQWKNGFSRRWGHSSTGK